jgi:hypothetical protein
MYPINEFIDSNPYTWKQLIEKIGYATIILENRSDRLVINLEYDMLVFNKSDKFIHSLDRYKISIDLTDKVVRIDLKKEDKYIKFFIMNFDTFRVEYRGEL